MVDCERFLKIAFDLVSPSISCSCRHFETFGKLCCHALKVFEANDVNVISDEFILKRWTREAQCSGMQDLRGKDVEGDSKLSSTRRLRNIVSKFIKVTAKTSPYEECLKVVDSTLDVMCKQIMEIRLQDKNNDNDTSVFMSNGVMQLNRFKKRISLKRQKRCKGRVELQPTRRKKAQPRGQPLNQAYKVFLKYLLEYLIRHLPLLIHPKDKKVNLVSHNFFMALLNDADIARLC